MALGVLAVLFVSASPALAQPGRVSLPAGVLNSAFTNDLTTAPAWLNKPTAAQIAAVFPASSKWEGAVYLSCQVLESGELRNCKTTGEVPEANGFGAAALSLARRMRMEQPRLALEGKRPRSTVVDTVTFVMVIARPGDTFEPGTCLPLFCITDPPLRPGPVQP